MSTSARSKRNRPGSPALDVSTTTDEPTTAQKAIAVVLAAPRATVRALAEGGSAVVSAARRYGGQLLSVIFGVFCMWVIINACITIALALAVTVPGQILVGVVVFLVLSSLFGGLVALVSNGINQAWDATVGYGTC